MPPIPSHGLGLLDREMARLPALNCKRLCQEYCGPIAMGRMEHKRIVARLGHQPVHSCVSCPMLAQDGACGIHDIRPLVCRLWGLVEAMPCPHGCRPERWVTEEESRRLIAISTKAGIVFPEMSAAFSAEKPQS